MAFLNKTKMAKRVAAIGVEDHLLLKETKLTESEKTAYVEGLVFAALMDDEKVDAGELEAIGRLARSLHMDDAELKNCLETVKGLKTDDEKMSFAEEIVGALKRDTIPVRFIADVESLITKNGEIPQDAADGLDYLGSLLFEAQDWRAERVAKENVLEKTTTAKAAADLKALKEALETFIEPLASKKAVKKEDLSKLAEFWKDEALPQVEMSELYAWVKGCSAGRVTDSMIENLKKGRRLNEMYSGGFGGSLIKSAQRRINAVVEKRIRQVWLLFALIMKKYDVAAVDDDKLASLLHQATSKKAGSTEIFNETFAVLAKDYLGEYETGDDATSDDESAPESV